MNTVEPLNNGHGGDNHFVHCSEVEMYGQLWQGASSLSIVGGCPLIGVSIIGGFTVYKLHRCVCVCFNS